MDKGIDSARKRLEAEYDEVQACGGPLWERIHDNLCRVNLGAWKQRKMPLEWLFGMFAITAGKASLAGSPSGSGQAVFWEGAGEKPAYRLVDSGLVRMLPILEALCQDAPARGGVQVVAIDGRCASGKSTLAGQICAVTGAGLVHMDDFFLPRPLRTRERLQEPGGNVHYERVLQEVIPQVQCEGAFSYGRFDCSRMEMGESCLVPAGKLRVVEGAYSCHPLFGNYMDLRVFSDVPPEEQLARIESRNGAEALEAFRTRWIPMEESYFAAFGIREHAHLQV